MLMTVVTRVFFFSSLRTSMSWAQMAIMWSTVHLVTELVADNDPVRVAIQGNADIGAVYPYRFTDYLGIE